MIDTDELEMVLCPVCGREVAAVDGVMIGHRSGCITPDLRLSISCMAGGMTPAEAEALDEKLRKAAHP